MRQFGFVMIIIFLSAQGIGQTKWKPWIIAEGGPLWGAYEFTGDLRLQGGMKTNGWLIGAGAAYDPYRFKTVPIYVQGRKMFTSWKTKPFVLASLGANLELEKDQEPVETNPVWGRWVPPAYQYSNGIYAEGGLGFAFRTHKRMGFNLSLSYTHKTTEETYYGYAWPVGNSESTPVKNKYLMNRLALRVGFQF